MQNTRETAFALRKLSLTKAKSYLEDVLPTSRPSLSAGIVVVLGVLLRLSLATQMVRDAGLSSLLDSF